MFGETKHHHDGVRAFSVTVGYPGWNRESILIHEIQKAKKSNRSLEDCKFSVDYYHEEGDITEECKENLLLNINNYMKANDAQANKSAK
jgi:hypothetical protein